MSVELHEVNAGRRKRNTVRRARVFVTVLARRARDPRERDADGRRPRSRATRRGPAHIPVDR